MRLFLELIFVLQEKIRKHRHHYKKGYARKANFRNNMEKWNLGNNAGGLGKLVIGTTFGQGPSEQPLDQNSSFFYMLDPDASKMMRSVRDANLDQIRRDAAFIQSESPSQITAPMRSVSSQVHGQSNATTAHEDDDFPQIDTNYAPLPDWTPLSATLGPQYFRSKPTYPIFGSTSDHGQRTSCTGVKPFDTTTWNPNCDIIDSDNPFNHQFFLVPS